MPKGRFFSEVQYTRLFLLIICIKFSWNLCALSAFRFYFRKVYLHVFSLCSLCQPSEKPVKIACQGADYSYVGSRWSARAILFLTNFSLFNSLHLFYSIPETL